MDYSKSIQEIRAVARAGAVILEARINICLKSDQGVTHYEKKFWY